MSIYHIKSVDFSKNKFGKELFKEEKDESYFCIIEGDALSSLKKMPDNYFQSCITSPPYWGLRDYGIPNQIGAESDIDEYINEIVKIFNEVKRTLKEDGTLWLNLGDTYASNNNKIRYSDRKNPNRKMSYRPSAPNGLKEKDLIGVPWKIAFELQKSGWYLRSDIIWNKTNCQPESVKDRPTKCHEYIFLLTKSAKYQYNYDAIREPTVDGKGLRNRRTVWSIPTESNKYAHFAMFNRELIEPCILAGSNEGDLLLDPFFGSGTLGLSAIDLKRKVIGIELNPKYIDIAYERYSDYQKSLKINNQN